MSRPGRPDRLLATIKVDLSEVEARTALHAHQFIRSEKTMLHSNPSRQEHSAQGEARLQVAPSEERWRAVFENSAIGVALTDLNGRFLATNPVYQKMLGYSELELQALTFLDITHEQDRDDNARLIMELLA